MNELDNARRDINEIDAEMAKLFERRMKVSVAVAEYKKAHGLSIKDEDREREVIEKNRSLLSDSSLESYYVRFLKNNMSLSCEYQSRLINGLRVTYCGTEGAFGYIAAKRMFPEATLTAFRDFKSAYEAVESGEYDCAVLPLENSTEGEVGEVMDLIFGGNLYINQVIDLPVTHDLIACPGADMTTIKKVVSHPQALAQCGEYLRAHSLPTEAESNTAVAAKKLSESGDTSVAAIASAETAELYGLKILDTAINDSKDNTTRFAAFSMAQNKPAGNTKRADENFILVFTVQNEAGALAQTLNIIGAHGYNMRSLRSRPMRDLRWNYYFYIEAEGNINTQNGRDMLTELSAVCAKLRMAGSYYSKEVAKAIK